MTLGQFPAAALLFRKGYLLQGLAVVHEERSLDNVFHRRLPLIAEEGAWDPNRDKGAMPEGTPFKAAVDPLAYLVGRVEVKYGGDPAKSTVADLSKYIDPSRKTTRSITGQITTDLARGLYLVDAPKAQGVTGFLGGAGPQRLSDVTVDCANQYASVVVIPLDDQPIATSRRLLVQVGTVCRPTGWRDARCGFRPRKASWRGAGSSSLARRPGRWRRRGARSRSATLRSSKPRRWMPTGWRFATFRSPKAAVTSNLPCPKMPSTSVFKGPGSQYTRTNLSLPILPRR